MSGLSQCAREDSNLHGPFSPRGPQPGSVGVDGVSASRSSNCAGFWTCLDGMDVVTGVVTEAAGGADTIAVVSVDERPFDWAEHAREKQASRDEDARALASSEKSVEQLREENECSLACSPTPASTCRVRVVGLTIAGGKARLSATPRVVRIFASWLRLQVTARSPEISQELSGDNQVCLITGEKS